MAFVAKRMFETYRAAEAASPATLGKRRLESTSQEATTVTTSVRRAAGRSLRKRRA